MSIKVGDIFGNLKVIEITNELDKSRHRYYKVVCICGNTSLSLGRTLTQIISRTQKFSSCGGCNAELAYPQEYNSWRGMKARCYNTNEPSYPYYGGRGIIIYPEWRHNFFAFFNYIGPIPGPGYTIDREDNNGNYEPNNIRWATKSEQQRNKRYFCKEFISTRLRSKINAL